MRTFPRTRWSYPVVLLALGITLAACGKGVPKASGPASNPSPSLSADTTGSPAAAGPQAPAVKPDLPNVEVIDVGSGAKVNVASLAPAAHPFLFWFWAPH